MHPDLVILVSAVARTLLYGLPIVVTLMMWDRAQHRALVLVVAGVGVTGNLTLLLVDRGVGNAISVVVTTLVAFALLELAVPSRTRRWRSREDELRRQRLGIDRMPASGPVKAMGPLGTPPIARPLTPTEFKQLRPNA